MAGNRQRADLLLVEKGLADSRNKARALIMAGRIKAGDMVISKPGEMVDRDTPLDVAQNALPYVSRGGLKLEKALDTFAIFLSGKIVIDVGASTGGFTDCALQRGALKVYAVDVGYGQLDWKLRQDHRVVVMERQNIRYLQPEQITDPLDFATVDVAFISLRLVLPVLAKLKVPEGVLLIKPQFEAGPANVGKGGVVRNREVHKEVIKTVVAAASGTGYNALGLTHSPIKGPKGNIEYLLHLSRKKSCAIEIAGVVEQAFN